VTQLTLLKMNVQGFCSKVILENQNHAALKEEAIFNQSCKQ